MEKHVLVVELLLLHGASVQVLNKRQCTAIDCAEQVGGRASGRGAPSASLCLKQICSSKSPISESFCRGSASAVKYRLLGHLAEVACSGSRESVFQGLSRGAPLTSAGVAPGLALDEQSGPPRATAG